MKKLAKTLGAFILTVAGLALSNSCEAARPKLNYYYSEECLIEVKDKIGDDKGNGYYQYPLDKRLTRGTFDIKNFRVYDEGEVMVFEIQMRNYIMRTWSNTGKSESRGFVANLWDIYIDIDGMENSGHNEALPGRDVLFADKMGWEKAIMICPMDPITIEEILRDMTDEIEFQDCIADIIIPDYVEVQGDRVITKISKQKLPKISNKSGFQCFSMGYKNVVSSNRLLNRDIKAFPTNDDFGGGSNDYGEPTIIDMITPKGVDQYKILKNYTTAAYRDNIRYAEVPFIYKDGTRISPAVANLRRAPMASSPQEQIHKEPANTPIDKPSRQGQAPKGFVPLKQKSQENNGYNSVPSGFMPVKKN